MNRFWSPKLGDVVEPVRTWNPATQASEAFPYIDLSAVDQSAKQIINATLVAPDEAPSRARQLVRTDDILVSTVRPNLNAVAKVTSAFDGATASTGFCVLRPAAGKLDPSYLFHWVRNPRFIDDMVRNATGASYPAVSDRIVKNSIFPLPPLDEQRRIAAILDKADALRQKRKRAIALLDSLTQSIFLEMFGDLSINPNGWPMTNVGSVCDRICVGIVVTPAAYYRPQGVPALRSLNVDVDSFKLNDLVFVSPEDNDAKLQKSKLRSGDVVVVRTGQPGKAAVVTNELDGANAIDLLIVSPNEEVLDPQFFSCLMNSEVGKRIVLSEKRGQIQQHFNVGSLKAASVPLPPIQEQRAFVAVWRQLQDVLGAAQADASKLDTLFASLQHRAFTGQL